MPSRWTSIRNRRRSKVAKLPETYEGPPKPDEEMARGLANSANVAVTKPVEVASVDRESYQSRLVASVAHDAKRKVDLFARNRQKNVLMNRIVRALNDAVDDEMRKSLIREVADLFKLIE